MIKQQQALLETEGVEMQFTDAAIREISRVAEEVSLHATSCMMSKSVGDRQPLVLTQGFGSQQCFGPLAPLLALLMHLMMCVTTTSFPSRCMTWAQHK